MNDVVRCSWAGDDPIYCDYHDHEWGVPVHDDRTHFEMLTLEGFQAGLSWITILKRRDNFRKAFDNFDWEKVAGYSEKKIELLMNDSGIIRNRLKIRAAVNNAQRFKEVREEFGTFDKYLWGFTGNRTLYPATTPRTWKDIPTRSRESDALSKDLQKRGFKFVGTVIIYAHMQAIGMVNDHMEGCFRLGRGGRGQKTEIRDQKTEVRRQKTDNPKRTELM